MEKIDEINKRLFLLRKRLKSSPMREIFEKNTSKSIIQIYEKVYCKKSETLNIKFSTINNNEKTPDSNNSIVEKNDVLKNNNNLASISVNGHFEIIKGNNLQSLVESNNKSGVEKIHTTNSVDSGKSVKSIKNCNQKINEEKNKKKKSPKNNKVKQLPPDNLLFFDQRQNFEKNSGITNYKTINIKKEADIKNDKLVTEINKIKSDPDNKKSSSDIIMQSNINNIPPVPSSFLTSYINKAENNESSIINLKIETEKIQEIRRENEDEEYHSEEKEDLFSHTLPQEVFACSTEIRDEEDKYELIKTNPLSKNNIPIPQHLPTQKQPQIIESPPHNIKTLTSEDVSIPSQRHLGNKIMLPNTFNMEIVTQHNVSSLKKQPKIIYDEEETTQNKLDEVGLNHDIQMKEVEDVCATSINKPNNNKIKIKLGGIINDDYNKISDSGNQKDVDKLKLNVSSKVDCKNIDRIEIQKTKLKGSIVKSLDKNLSLNESDSNKRKENSIEEKEQMLNKVKQSMGNKERIMKKEKNQSISQPTHNKNIEEVPKIKSNSIHSSIFKKEKDTEDYLFNNVLSKPSSNSNLQKNEIILPIKRNDSETIEIEKVDNVKYFLINLQTYVEKICTDFINLQKKAAQDQEIMTEFDNIKNTLQSLVGDTPIKGNISILEKTVKIIIKLLGIVCKDENNEHFNYITIEILDLMIQFIKRLIKIESSESRLLNSYRIIIKFLLCILRLKNYKPHKIKSLYVDIKTQIDSRKNIENKTLINLVNYAKESKQYYSSLENVNKLFHDIKIEEEKEDRQNKYKKSHLHTKTSDFHKTLKTLKKYCRTTIPYMSLSKCYNMMKIFNDLVITYIKDEK